MSKSRASSCTSGIIGAADQVEPQPARRRSSSTARVPGTMWMSGGTSPPRRSFSAPVALLAQFVQELLLVLRGLERDAAAFADVLGQFHHLEDGRFAGQAEDRTPRRSGRSSASVSGVPVARRASSACRIITSIQPARTSPTVPSKSKNASLGWISGRALDFGLP